MEGVTHTRTGKTVLVGAHLAHVVSDLPQLGQGCAHLYRRSTVVNECEMLRRRQVRTDACHMVMALHLYAHDSRRMPHTGVTLVRVSLLRAVSGMRIEQKLWKSAMAIRESRAHRSAKISSRLHVWTPVALQPVEPINQLITILPYSTNNVGKRSPLPWFCMLKTPYILSKRVLLFKYLFIRILYRHSDQHQASFSAVSAKKKMLAEKSIKSSKLTFENIQELFCRCRKARLVHSP